MPCSLVDDYWRFNEDKRNMFFQNIGNLLQDHMVSQPERSQRVISLLCQEITIQNYVKGFLKSTVGNAGLCTCNLYGKCGFSNKLHNFKNIFHEFFSSEQ
jgi:hypothetical protein